MNIEKRKNGYRIRPTINGKRQSITFDHKPTQKEIREAIYEYDEKINDNLTFENATLIMIEDKSNVLSPSTVRKYLSLLRGYSDKFKNLKIDDINNQDIQKEVNRLSSYLSPKSVRGYYGLISSVFTYIRPSYDLRIKLPNKIIKPLYVPNTSDIQAILNYSRENSYAHRYIFPILCGCHGMRLGEVTALTDEDIDVENRLIYINKTKVLDKDNNFIIKPCAKTDTSNRVISVSDSVIDAYKEYGLYKGHPKTISKYMNETEKKLGLESFSFHKLRHYFASISLETLPMAVVQEFGGWSDTHTLNQIYTHNMRSLNEVTNVISNNIK